MRNIFRITFILLLIILAGYNLCLAQETYQKGELLTLYVGEIKIIAVNELTRVAISNPKVADVTSTKINEMIILAKDVGTTSLVWWDSLGQHSLQLQVFAENMSSAKQRIDRILKEMDVSGVYTRRADSEGKVLILGKVKTIEDLERIDTALTPLKEKITTLVKVEEETVSIEIEMQVLELKKDATETLGFTPPTSTSLSESMDKYGTTITDIPEALFHLTDWTRTALSAQLDFLIQEGKARVLSRPRLVCQSGKEAEFLVGGEKPILTTSVSEGGSATEVEYKAYGIQLKINPKFMPGNRIQVSLGVEVSEVGDAEILGTTAQPTAKAYPLTKRSTSTQLILDNGQTLAISGLIKEKAEETLRKFPILGDIPFIGMLFRGKTYQVGGGRGELADTELVITLTPTILPGTEAFPELVAAHEGKFEQVAKARVAYPEGEEQPGIDGYTLKVIQRIRDNFVYPQEAYKNKLSGLVNLSVHLTSAGELLEVKINKSSSWSILDNNAVRIIKRIAPFPPFPPEIRERELWINIPIAYNIE